VTPPPVQVWVRPSSVWRIIHNIVHVYTNVRTGDSFMRTGAAMDSVDGTSMEIDDVTAIDSVSIVAIDAGLGAYLEHPGTRQAEYSLSATISCKEGLNKIPVLFGLFLIQILHFFRQQVTQST
jgi:hypothetical protein